MIVSFSDPGYLAAIHFGLLNLVLLWAFASLIYEVEQGLHAIREFKDEEAHAILMATAHMNMIVVFSTIALIGYFCVQMGELAPRWELCFMLTLAGTALYWNYARSCEKKLEVFLSRVRQVARQSIKE